MLRLAWLNVYATEELLSWFGLNGQQGSDLLPVLRVPQKVEPWLECCFLSWLVFPLGSSSALPHLLPHYLVMGPTAFHRASSQ